MYNSFLLWAHYTWGKFDALQHSQHKMDLANMIVDASADKLKSECHKNTCKIVIHLHGRYNYVISITPMTAHVLLNYKTLEYKIARIDKESYNETLDFLLDAIENDCQININDDMEYGDLWPDNEEFWYSNYMQVTRHDARVFYAEFKRENMTAVVKNYMRTLRLLN